MNKKEFNESVKELVESLVISNNKELDFEEKIILMRLSLHKIEKEIEYAQENKGNSWTDDELKIILSMSPTKENSLKLAKAFKRGYGSIEQIFRWAATSDKALEEKGREHDSFILQIKKVAKEVGWRV